MNKLEILENIINKKIKILKNDFEVVIDSRLATNNTLFFAINKGNDYLEEAIKKGAFVIYDKNKKDIENSYYVENTVEFMQKFARIYRQNLKGKIVAITGSNGKTTVKDVLYSVLSKYNKCHKTKGNYNNHIGLPYTLLNSNIDNDYIILEMGMSNFGEIDLLANIAKPDVSIITNIGQSHLEFLKTMENVFIAKTEIIKHTKEKVFVPKLDKYLSKLENDKVIKVEKKYFETNLYGEHNQLNLSLVDKVLEYLNCKNRDYTKLEITNGRFQIINAKYKYINDAYNASPISMKASIETFNNMYENDYRIIAIADMLELGENSITYHKDISKTLEKTNFDEIILYGNYMKYLYDEIKDKYKVKHFENKEDIKNYISSIKTNKNISILLKGSRSMSMETIMEEN